MTDIIGHGGKGGGEQHTHYEASDSLHSISYARVLDLVSEGEILGLASGMESVYLNETPYQNANGTFNFKDATIDFRAGTQSQDYIPGFPDAESEFAVGTELRSTAPWVHGITNLSLSAIRITLGVPALSSADLTNGDIGGYNIDYKIELSADGGPYLTVVSNSFNGKTTTLYARTARIDLQPATIGWSVRVTRLTANAATPAINDTTTIISYAEVIDAKLRYPMSALVGVQIDAKQFSSIPTRAYDLYGRIIQVPSNYDPVARTYTGVWDGTFKPAWTSNPAWVFRDLVLNDRYGLGNRISASQIDKWALYAIAQYCDQTVPNGKGGTEPRFTCNVYIQSQKAAYAVMQDLASVFRGISYWGGGSIMASSDRPSDPVYIYTAANVVGGKFSRVGTSKKTRYTVALVSWNDPADFYRAKVEYVEDAEGIQRYGIQQISLTAFGCTSQGQAQRAGRWALTTSRLETDVISFDVGMDGAIALPGQIIRVADPSRMGRRVGGRMRTAAGRVVTLDKAPAINVGDKLAAILPTGVSETRNVVSVSGDAVTVDADWSTLPIAQSVWSVDSSTLVAPTFKVLHVTEKQGGLEYSITATQHEPGKFDFIDSNTAIITHPQTALDVSKQAAPASVTVSGNTVSLNDVQKIVLTVACAPVDGAVAYEGAYKYGNGNWVPLPRQSGATFDIQDVIPGSYIARLSAVNSIGITSVETVSAATTITKNVNSIYDAASRLNNALVYAYQRAASMPTGTPGAVDYDFVAKTITTATLTNSWQKTIPTANGYPLYVAVATASSASSTDNIASAEWSSAVVLATDGPGGTGTNGLNTATAFIYQRSTSSTAPALPSVAATYNFGASTPLTGLNNGWSAGVPPVSDASYLFVSTATASSATGSDSISSSEWAAAQILAQDGVDGMFVDNDPNFTDAAKWSLVTNNSGLAPEFAFVTASTGSTAPTCVYVRNSVGTADASVWLLDTRMYPVNPTRAYELAGRIFSDAGNGRAAYLAVEFYDAAGTRLASTSWGGTWGGYAWTGIPADGKFTRFSGSFGGSAGNGRPIPASATQCRIGVILNYNAGGSNLRMAAQEVRLGDITESLTAQSAADTANAALANIASDNILSPGEKPAVAQDYTVITTEQAGIGNRAAYYGITTEKTDYDSAISALTTYLGTLTGWNTIPGADVTIVGTTFRAKFSDVYAKRQTLINAIYTASGNTATWGGIPAGSGKPDDNATVGAPSGTNVAGVLADTLVTQAAAGSTANTTLNSPPVIAGIGTVSASVYKPAVVIATIYPSVTGGVGPYRFDWSVVRVVDGDGDAYYTLTTTGSQVNDKLIIKGMCLISGGTETTDVVTCTATDSKGRTSTTQFNVSVSG